MSDTTTIEEEYEYPGWLVFNGLYKTRVRDETDISPSEVVENFPKYTPGSPNDPGYGFEPLELSENLRQMGELSEAFEDFAQGVESLKYVDEDWIEQIGYDEHGNEKLYFLPDHDQMRIYWDYVNDVMIIKGQKTLVSQAEGDLKSALSENVQLNSINFDFDFFLWILYKKYRGDPLSSDLRVRKITRGSTIAETRDNMGAGTVRESNNVLKSVIMIASVLSGKKIDELTGDFILGNHRIEAQIEFGGKVHVFVTDSPLSTLSHLRRMGVSLRFLSELVNLYDDWKHLDPEDRYPPPSFFDEMAENAEEEGWPPIFDPEEVKARYERKRQGTGTTQSESVPAEDA